MKSIVLVTLALVAMATSAPFEETKFAKPDITIIKYNSEAQPDGSYTFNYETSDGSSRQEEGIVREALDEENKPQKVVVVSGTYTVLDAEGKPETIKYFADETGYHAEGKSIPKAIASR